MFARGNCVGRCRWPGRLPRGSPVSPSARHSGAAPFPPHFTLVDSPKTLHSGSVPNLYAESRVNYSRKEVACLAAMPNHSCFELHEDAGRGMCGQGSVRGRRRQSATNNSIRVVVASVRGGGDRGPRHQSCEQLISLPGHVTDGLITPRGAGRGDVSGGKNARLGRPRGIAFRFPSITVLKGNEWSVEGWAAVKRDEHGAAPERKVKGKTGDTRDKPTDQQWRCVARPPLVKTRLVARADVGVGREGGEAMEREGGRNESYAPSERILHILGKLVRNIRGHRFGSDEDVCDWVNMRCSLGSPRVFSVVGLTVLSPSGINVSRYSCCSTSVMFVSLRYYAARDSSGLFLHDCHWFRSCTACHETSGLTTYCKYRLFTNKFIAAKIVAVCNGNGSNVFITLTPFLRFSELFASNNIPDKHYSVPTVYTQNAGIRYVHCNERSNSTVSQLLRQQTKLQTRAENTSAHGQLLSRTMCAIGFRGQLRSLRVHPYHPNPDNPLAAGKKKSLAGRGNNYPYTRKGLLLTEILKVSPSTEIVFV
ncbi:hypothetical protein PR048_017802 [Dryococelus australis]|uniref:Uncharacterized protein n=1 Tax=Dryococelus australis TaxID=614101 RepID=A0ABQ9HAN8_9NEOP|nr:hypothetical protein PR048_017802 [Dryococelus australis]